MVVHRLQKAEEAVLGLAHSFQSLLMPCCLRLGNRPMQIFDGWDPIRGEACTIVAREDMADLLPHVHHLLPLVLQTGEDMVAGGSGVSTGPMGLPIIEKVVFMVDLRWWLSELKPFLPICGSLFSLDDCLIFLLYHSDKCRGQTVRLPLLLLL